MIEALAIDANYVAAKVMLAKTWWYDARFFTDGEERRHAIAEAERLAREVLEQSPDAANAMMTLGGTAWLRDEHDEAVEYCRRAADQSPSDAFVLGFLGMILIFRGNLDEALVVLGRAERLSPQAIAWVDFHIAHARAWTGDDSGALAKINSYIAAAPHEPFGQVMLAVVHGFAGRMPAARSAVAEALLLEPDLDQHQVSRSHRYRDPGRLEKMIAVLNEAGLPA